jgi:hypothetical protein
VLTPTAIAAMTRARGAFTLAGSRAGPGPVVAPAVGSRGAAATTLLVPAMCRR